MLRKLRIAAAAVSLTCLTLSFSGVGAWLFHRFAHLQLIPAVIAGNIAVIVAVSLLTLVFGRLYCSVICPLGIFQDLVLAFKKKRKYKYGKALNILRYSALALFVAALAFGIHFAAVLLDPYSAYGRMVNFTLAGLFTLAVTVPFAIFGGRLYCNSICPAGAFLSLLSRHSLFRVRVNKEKCVGCGLCEKKCKASCIDSKSGSIDSSRCVGCFDCLEACHASALEYKPSMKKTSSQRKTADTGRRAFLSTVALVGGSLALDAQKIKLDGGLAEVLPKQSPVRTVRLVPPGAKGEKHFYDKCTGCQMCVSACPNDVLRPSMDLEHLLQPRMEYDRGWCRPECTDCSDVCPSGAILPVEPERKSLIHIGLAKVDLDLCIVNRDGVECGNCARHCPSGAVRMVRKDKDNPDSLRIPVIIADKCLGCGACEFLCPSRPLSAITVDGRPEHIED